jgi:hypothetical protein
MGGVWHGLDGALPLAREHEAGDKELPCGRVVTALLVQPSCPGSAD